MRMHYHSDNGPPCWKCSGTIYSYTIDDKVTYVAAHCIGCGADNMFYPPKHCSGCDSPSAVSLAHRESRYPTRQNSLDAKSLLEAIDKAQAAIVRLERVAQNDMWDRDLEDAVADFALKAAQVRNRYEEMK